MNEDESELRDSKRHRSKYTRVQTCRLLNTHTVRYTVHVRRASRVELNCVEMVCDVYTDKVTRVISAFSMSLKPATHTHKWADSRGTRLQNKHLTHWARSFDCSRSITHRTVHTSGGLWSYFTHPNLSWSQLLQHTIIIIITIQKMKTHYITEKSFGWTLMLSKASSV